MQKHVEIFRAKKGYKLAIIVLIPISLFSKQKFVVHFSNIICTKPRPCTSLLYIWKWITSNGNVFSTVSYIFGLKVQFFQKVFFQVYFLTALASRSRLIFDFYTMLVEVKHFFVMNKSQPFYKLRKQWFERYLLLFWCMIPISLLNGKFYFAEFRSL